MLQCVAVCCRVFYCVALCCSALINLFEAKLDHYKVNVLVCCSVLQCVVVCCSVLQCADHPVRVQIG